VIPLESRKGDKAKGETMNLTKRGVIVRNVVIALLVLLAVMVADSITTPDACKVDVNQMSQGCKDLLYP
jgi:hypothetical protein